jgi:hypothetical protein
MRALGTTELLSHWEAGTTQPRWDWARGLVHAAFPEIGRERFDLLTVGERDTRLLELREALFGTELAGLSTCSGCGATVELEFSAAELRAKPSEAAGDACIHVDGCDVRFRVPNTADLVEAARARDVTGMREVLLERCVLLAESAGGGVSVRKLPAEAVERVVEKMAAADPQADLRLQMTCPDCGKTWSESFDIVSFLWSEVDAWAQRLLRDVHLLASVYGWSEAEVLAVTPQRRARYLEMIGA